ncbi:MAG: cell division protein FtsA [Bacteroidota bacterium]
MVSKTNHSVVIDIGTSKIVALAGRPVGQGKIELLGMAQTPSKGIKRGVVFNLDEVAESIHLVLENLENQIKQEVNIVHVAYAGQQMKTIDFQTSRIMSDEGVVSQFDIDDLYNEAKKVELADGYRILEIIPQKYIIDDDTEELNPVGITARKMEARYKLLVVPETYLINLQRVFEKVGVELGELVHASLAVAEAALTSDEKEMGSIVLDMGSGTTKIAVYHDNALLHAAVIPFGGSVVTKDIKEGCSILLKWAEQLKVQYGQALGDFADDQKVVTIAGNNGWEPKEISFKSLAFIIQARLEEIIDCVYSEIEKSGIEDQLGAGIVLAGGTSKLENIESLVKFRTGMDVRMAHPVILPVNKKEEIQNPDYLTALGIMKLVLESSENTEKVPSKKPKKKKEGGGISPWFNKVVQGVLDYVDDDNDDIALN